MKEEHPIWARVTLSWMFTPFTIHLGIFCYQRIRNKLKGRTAADVCRNLNCRRPKCSNQTNCCESSCFCLCFCVVRLNFKEVCYHLPFVQTFRNIYNAWRLHKLGYGRADFDVTKSAEVEAILKEVGLAGQYESFFESGPQSITQCVIILSTGKISSMQMISITISVASLTWGAGRSFFIQREAHMSDPDPPASMVLARVFFYMFTVTFNSLLLWTFIGSLLGKYTVVAALLSFSTIYTSVKLLEKNEHEDNEVESSSFDGQEAMKEPQYFCLKAAICTVWVPSVVGDRKRMFIVSAVVGLVSKLLFLGLAVGIGLSGNQHLVHRDPFLIWCQQLELVQARVATEKTLEMCSFRNPSFPRCFEFGSSDTILKDDTEVKEKLANNETSINEVLNQVNTSKGKEREIPTEEIERSGNKTIDKEISNSTDEDIFFPETNTTLTKTKSQAYLIQKVRICGTHEEELVFSLYVSALLLISTLASFLSSWMLFKISDYAYLYEISKRWLWVFKTEPIVHRCLLFSTVQGETDIPLKELLQRGKMQEYVNRPNYQGKFALHLSAERKNAMWTLLLMEAGAKQHQEAAALEKLMDTIDARNKDDVDVINKIASIIIEEALENETYRGRAIRQLTIKNDQGQSFLSVLKEEHFVKVFRWNPRFMLMNIDALNEKRQVWLVQETNKLSKRHKEDMYNFMMMKNKDDKPVFSTLPNEQQGQVFLWNKEKTLKPVIIHLMSKDNIMGLVQQTTDGHWSIQEVFDALTKAQKKVGSNSNEKISEALALLKEIEKEQINILEK